MLNLSGIVTVTRRLADHWVWQREPLCAMGAWVDLLLLARQEPGEMTINGQAVKLERGDVGFAIHTLASRWRRSREWATKFLRDCEERRMVELIPVEPGAPRRGTIIRITNFDTYNPATVPTTEPTSNPATDSTQSKEVGRGSKEERKGEGTNFVPIEDAIRYFRKQNADYTDDEIRSAWHELTAAAVNGQWMVGRPLRVVADWRSALESELWKRRQLFGAKKNPARGPVVWGDEPPAPAVKTSLNLQSMKGTTCD